jgi:hypothetical protein
MEGRKIGAAGRVEFAREGYRLTWGPEGLIVEAIDYHTRPLGLSWQFLRELVDAGVNSPELSQPS